MKLAVITDSSAFLDAEVVSNSDLYILDIPVSIDGVEYIEGKNLTSEEFYQKMAAAKELPKTSQPSLARLEEILETCQKEGYTHVLGLFLSSGISGFYQNIQFLKEEFEDLTIAFPDTKITSAPLGIMVKKALENAKSGKSFEEILEILHRQIERTSAFIMVDDLNHMVKGGRLSNGAAMLGTLLSIKPILYFNEEGVIEVFEKVRTEKKATKRLIELIKEKVAGGDYEIIIIHAHAEEKAEDLRKSLLENGVKANPTLATFGSVIGTHLGEGSVALGYIPRR